VAKSLEFTRRTGCAVHEVETAVQNSAMEAA
jgi:hypothetical protein